MQKTKAKSQDKNWVPMEGEVVLNTIDHLDHKPVTFPCYDPRPRKLPVDSHNALCLTKPFHIM